MAKVLDSLERKFSDKKWFSFLKELIFRFKEDGVSEIGAQSAYYIILSIFPFLIFLLSILKFTPLSDVKVLEQILSVLPEVSQDILFNLITGIVQSSNMALLSFGALGAIWSSSKGVNSIIKSINRAYDLEENRSFLRLRGLAILLTLVLSLTIIIAFGVLVFGEVLFKLLFTNYTRLAYLGWTLFKLFIPLIFMGFMISILYKFSPSVKNDLSISFKETLPGSLFASVSLTLFSMGFSFYVNNFANYSKSYGSIGGLIVLLIWIYAASTVVILGAEINATLLSMKKRAHKDELTS